MGPGVISDGFRQAGTDSSNSYYSVVPCQHSNSADESCYGLAGHASGVCASVIVKRMPYTVDKTVDIGVFEAEDEKLSYRNGQRAQNGKFETSPPADYCATSTRAYQRGN